MTKSDFIKQIIPNEPNFKYCAEKGIINGTLFFDIERIMKEYADQQLILHGATKSLPSKEDDANELSKRLFQIEAKPDYGNKKPHYEGYACGWHERDLWQRCKNLADEQ